MVKRFIVLQSDWLKVDGKLKYWEIFGQDSCHDASKAIRGIIK